MTNCPLPPRLTSDEPIWTRPGDLWLQQTGNIGLQALQLISWNSTNSLFRIWRPDQPWHLTRNPHPTLSSGDLTWLSLDACESLQNKILTTTPISGSCQIKLVIPSSFITRPLLEHNPPPSDNLTWASDGAWSAPLGIFPTLPPTGGFAVVGILPDPPHTIIHQLRCEGLFVHDRRRAFIQESMGAAVALRQTDGMVHSDCKAVVGLSTNFKARNPLQDVIKQLGRGRLTHVYGHPELRSESRNWSPAEHAIAAADNLASRPNCLAPQSMTPSDLISEIFSRTSQWFLTQNNELFLGNIAHTNQVRILHDYITNRNLRYKTNIWTPVNFRFAITAQKSTRSQRGALQKLFFKRFDRDRLFSLDVLSPCSCGCSDTLETWTTSCTESIMQTNFAIGKANIANFIRNQPQLTFLNNALAQSPTLWRGIWSPQLQEEINHLALSGNQDSHLILLKSIQALTALIMNTSLQLYHTRQDPVTIKILSPAESFITYLQPQLTKSQRKKFQHIIPIDPNSHLLQTTIRQHLTPHNPHLSNSPSIAHSSRRQAHSTSHPSQHNAHSTKKQRRSIPSSSRPQRVKVPFATIPLDNQTDQHQSAGNSTNPSPSREVVSTSSLLSKYSPSLKRRKLELLPPSSTSSSHHQSKRFPSPTRTSRTQHISSQGTSNHLQYFSIFRNPDAQPPVESSLRPLTNKEFLQDLQDQGLLPNWSSIKSSQLNTAEHTSIPPEDLTLTQHTPSPIVNRFIPNPVSHVNTPVNNVNQVGRSSEVEYCTNGESEP